MLAALRFVIAPKLCSRKIFSSGSASDSQAQGVPGVHRYPYIVESPNPAVTVEDSAQWDHAGNIHKQSQKVLAIN